MLKLSYSACSKYLLSPFSYYAHYILRLRTKNVSSPLLFGSALDKGLNILLEHKKDPLLLNKIYGISKDVKCTDQEVLAHAKREFDIEFGAIDPYTIKYSKADLDTSSLPEAFHDIYPAPKAPLAWYCLKYKGYLLIDEYVAQVLPRIQEVYEVQKQISSTNEMGDTFIGVIDFIAKIDDKIWIADNKSTSIKYAEDSVTTSEQLASYYEIMRDAYDLAGACYITIPKNLRKKKKPVVDISFIFGTIEEELIDKTFQDYEAVLHGIKNAQFGCTREQQGGCCSKPWPCDFSTFCKSGGTNMTGLVVKPAEDKKR